MRILNIIPQLVSGGGERFTIDLCNAMAEQGHEVMLVVFFAPEGQLGFYKDDLSDKVKLVSLDKKMGLDLSLGFKLRKLIREFAPDVVNSHLRAMFYMPIPALTTKAKFFHTVHNTAEVEAANFVGGAIRKFMFKTGKVTPITISPESLASFENFYGQTAPMIFNGRDVPEDLEISESVKNEIDSYKSTPNSKVIVHIARFTDVKRQDLMARVSKRLHDEGFDFIVMLIGKLSDEIVKGVEEANCPICHVLGERHNPLEYLKASDFFCLCSTYEGMPITLIEALGTGAIPVCTPVGGIVNVVKDGDTGFLSTDISEEAYYNALKRALQMSDNDISVMKTKVKETYKPFTMQECAKNYIDLYNK